MQIKKVTIKRRYIQRYFLAVAALSGLVASAAAAEPGASPLSVEIEIAERTAAPDALAVTLMLVGEHGCAQVEARRAKLSYDVEVCREGGELGAPILKFSISRNENSAQQSSTTKFKVTGQLHGGQRVVLGKLRYSDSVETQISASLR